MPKISLMRFPVRLNGKLATVIDQVEHGHHVFRAYWKNSFLKQYEKFSCFLRNELCSNNLRDFGLKKGIDHLEAVRKRFQIITDRFAGFQAQSLNVYSGSLCRSRSGRSAIPESTFMRRESFPYWKFSLHNRTTIRGCTVKQIHEAVVSTFQLSPKTYRLNQLRYDLRKLKGHGVLERDGRRYATA
jgi:hypothetical protein